MTYIQPTYTAPFPRSLSLSQFLQTVIVGISGISGELVRPEWQVEPPKNPDINVNWIGMGVSLGSPDANGYIGVNSDGNTVYQRHEILDIGLAIYGPAAFETAGLIRDGFQIPTNLVSLRFANMGFIEVSPARRVPDLVNQRYINRVQMDVFLRREIQREYPIPTILSAAGTIHTVIGDEDYLLPWSVDNP